MRSKRRNEIDIARAIGMFWVVTCHFQLNYQNGDIPLWISTFHMPLFFFLNGLTMKPCEDAKGFLRFIEKRFYTILLPYLVLITLYSTPEVGSIVANLYGSNRAIHSVGGFAALWFLPCLFAADIIADGVISVFYKIKANGGLRYIYMACVIVLLACISALMARHLPEIGYPFSIDVAFSGAIYIFAGYALSTFKPLKERIEAWDWKRLLAASVVLFALSIALVPTNLIYQDGGYYGPGMALSVYGVYPIFILQGLAGSLSILFFSMCLAKRYRMRLLCIIGQNTLLMLGTHQVFIMGLEAVYAKIGLSLNLVVYFISSIAVTMVSFAFSYFVAWIFTRQFMVVFGSRFSGTLKEDKTGAATPRPGARQI